MLLLTSTLLLSGCAVEKITDNAVVAGLSPLADELAQALLVDGGPKSTVAGVKLIKAIDDLKREKTNG